VSVGASAQQVGERVTALDPLKLLRTCHKSRGSRSPCGRRNEPEAGLDARRFLIYNRLYSLRLLGMNLVGPGSTLQGITPMRARERKTIRCTPAARILSRFS
jgi:hypothetical protein